MKERAIKDKMEMKDGMLKKEIKKLFLMFIEDVFLISEGIIAERAGGEDSRKKGESKRTVKKTVYKK